MSAIKDKPDLDAIEWEIKRQGFLTPSKATALTAALREAWAENERRSKRPLEPTHVIYVEWFNELKRISGQADLNAVDWAAYWADAYSPAAAWAEDQSYD